MNIDLLKAANHWKGDTMNHPKAQPTTTSDRMFFMDITDEEWDALPGKVQERIRRLYANALTQATLLAALKELVGEALDLTERVFGSPFKLALKDAIKAIAHAEGGTKP